jgi:hypothetical protein
MDSLMGRERGAADAEQGSYLLLSFQSRTISLTDGWRELSL